MCLLVCVICLCARCLPVSVLFACLCAPVSVVAFVGVVFCDLHFLVLFCFVCVCVCVRSCALWLKHGQGCYTCTGPTSHPNLCADSKSRADTCEVLRKTHARRCGKWRGLSNRVCHFEQTREQRIANQCGRKEYSLKSWSVDSATLASRLPPAEHGLMNVTTQCPCTAQDKLRFPKFATQARA